MKKINPEIPAIKDEESEHPIPTEWRPVICDIVRAFVRHDYQLDAGIAGVAPVSEEDAEQIRDYISDYGEVLTELTEETWNSSVCIWDGRRWDALIDLWTVAEGRGDLVLRLFVNEVEGRFEFDIYMVYIP